MRYLLGFLLVIFVAVLSGLGYFYSEINIDTDKIVNYNPKLTSQIFDRNGQLVANVFDDENRQYTPYDEIPPLMVEALVAIEDTGFFEHGGINMEAIFRAAVKDIKAMSFVEGASTITQQLVKNMLLTRDKKITRKLKEVILAYDIENKLSKEQIIERYLNQVYFGHQYYGVKTAARGYFNKSLSELNLKEIAILVGLPKAPSSYDPTRHLDLSLSRANNVIKRMFDLGWINKSQYDNAMEETPTIYNATLTQNRAPFLVDEAIKQASKIYPDIKTGGYQINLTADLTVQNMAKTALRYGYNQILKRNKKASEETLNGAIIVTNPTNGNILALVGGVDYAKSSFNRVTQSIRQPGSSFKPFIFQIALNKGYSPSTMLADVPRIFIGSAKNEENWKPKNYGGKLDFLGFIPMREALRRSRNLATINLLSSIGLKEAKDGLENLGFKDVPPNLSIALGSVNTSPYEFAQNFSIFAGMGKIAKNKLISSIVSKDGKTLVFRDEIIEVEPPEQAYLMVDMLRDVVSKGTGRRAKVSGIEIAGKTGTTNDNIDAWFVGSTPELEATIWYGNDNNTPMRRYETGGITAAPVFKYFLTEYLKVFPETKRTFAKPNGIFRVKYKGNDEIYTKISPLPIIKKSKQKAKEEKDGLIL